MGGGSIQCIRGYGDLPNLKIPFLFYTLFSKNYTCCAIWIVYFDWYFGSMQFSVLQGVTSGDSPPYIIFLVFFKQS